MRSDHLWYQAQHQSCPQHSPSAERPAPETLISCTRCSGRWSVTPCPKQGEKKKDTGHEKNIWFYLPINKRGIQISAVNTESSFLTTASTFHHRPFV